MQLTLMQPSHPSKCKSAAIQACNTLGLQVVRKDGERQRINKWVSGRPRTACQPEAASEGRCCRWRCRHRTPRPSPSSAAQPAWQQPPYRCMHIFERPFSEYFRAWVMSPLLPANPLGSCLCARKKDAGRMNTWMRALGLTVCLSTFPAEQICPKDLTTDAVNDQPRGSRKQQ